MDPRVSIVLSLIEQDISNAPNQAALARHLRLSSSRLSHLIKAETGSSLNQHLRALRMQKAKALMESTLLTVKETMTAVGFTDLSHFVREFKNLYGLSPSQHRKLHLNVNQLKDFNLQPAKSANNQLSRPTNSNLRQ
jgi:AraC family transcriptional regulator, arabinose operon regulatory protein